MDLKTEKLIKNTGILAVGNFGSKILIFLLVPLYTAVLTVDEYGSYDILISTISLLIPILTLNISDAILRFPIDKNADNPKIIHTGIMLVFLSGIIVLLIQVFPNSPWAQMSGIQYLGAVYYSTAFYQLLTLFARGLEKMALVAISGLINTSTMIILNVVLLLVFDFGLDGFFIAQIVSMISPSVFLVVYLRKEIFARPKTSNNTLILKMVKYSLPLATTVVGWWFITTADRYIILVLCGVEANGLYSIAYKIPAILSTISGIFLQAWQVSAVKSFDPCDSDSFLRNTFKTVEMLLVLICSILLPFTPVLAAFLFSGDFYSAWEYVPLLLIYAVLNTMGGMWAPFFSVGFSTKPMVISTLLSGVVNVILGIILVTFLGIQGAVISSLVSSVINWGYRGIKVKKCISVDFGMKKSLVLYLILVIQASSILVFSSAAWIPLNVFLFSGLVFFYKKNLINGFVFLKSVFKRKGKE